MQSSQNVQDYILDILSRPFDKLPRHAPRQAGTGGAGRAGSSGLSSRTGRFSQTLQALVYLFSMQRERRVIAGMARSERYRRIGCPMVPSLLLIAFADLTRGCCTNRFLGGNCDLDRTQAIFSSNARGAVAQNGVDEVDYFSYVGLAKTRQEMIF
jgi:hypothetical protein